jgi:hypothetical protein
MNEPNTTPPEPDRPKRLPDAVHSCAHIGVAGTTDVHVRHIQEAKAGVGKRGPIPDVFEARVGVAIMGSVNDEASIGMDPFDRKFRDNFARGYGTTEQEAIDALRADMESIAEGLWA